MRSGASEFEWVKKSDFGALRHHFFCVIKASILILF
jgi:hypothetical protein